MAENKDAASSVARAVTRNFDKLPEYTASSVAYAVTRNFDKLPEYTAWSVAYAVALHFDELPEKVQNLLFKVVDNKYAASSSSVCSI